MAQQSFHPCLALSAQVVQNHANNNSKINKGPQNLTWLSNCSILELLRLLIKVVQLKQALPHKKPLKKLPLPNPKPGQSIIENLPQATKKSPHDYSRKQIAKCSKTTLVSSLSAPLKILPQPILLYGQVVGHYKSKIKRTNSFSDLVLMKHQ